MNKGDVKVVYSEVVKFVVKIYFFDVKVLFSVKFIWVVCIVSVYFIKISLIDLVCLK